jgi:hypothetical protein
MAEQGVLVVTAAGNSGNDGTLVWIVRQGPSHSDKRSLASRRILHKRRRQRVRIFGCWKSPREAPDRF